MGGQSAGDHECACKLTVVPWQAIVTPTSHVAKTSAVDVARSNIHCNDYDISRHFERKEQQL